MRRRDDTKGGCAHASDPHHRPIPRLYQYQPKTKVEKKQTKWNLTARTFPALVFSLVPNSFVYSDTLLQLARRWKSILQHLACVLHFADELCLLAAFCCPRKEKLLMGGEFSEGPPAYTGKSIRFACVQLAPPLFICFCFIFKKQKLNKNKKNQNIGHKPLSGFLGFLGSEKKGEPSFESNLLQVSPDVDSGTGFQSLPTNPPFFLPPSSFFLALSPPPPPKTCWLRISLES